MRVKGGPQTRRKRKGVKRLVEGAWGTKHTSYKIARQTLIRSSEYAYRDRRAKKRDFRQLWNARMNASLRELGYNYSTFINAMKKKNIKINRKMVSELAIKDKDAFANLVKVVMEK